MNEIVRADSRLERRRFYLFSRELYRREPLGVESSLWRGRAVLDPAVNPLLRAPHALFLAREDGRTVARVLTGLASGGQGYFTLFDAADRPRAVEEMMDAVFAWQREMGAKSLSGPISPCPAEIGGGVLAAGFDCPPAAQDAYNFPYYDALLRRCGLRPREEQLGYRVECSRVDRLRYARGAEWLKARLGVRVEENLPAAPNRLVRALSRVADMPVGAARETVAWLMRGLAREYCPAALLEEETIALALGLRGKAGRPPRIAMLWTKEGWRGRGIAAALFSSLLENAISRGVEAVDASLIDVDNLPSRRSVEALGGRVVHRYLRYFSEI